LTNFRLTLEYDGAGFEGWQRQAERHRTVQGVLEEAIAAVTRVRAAVVGAGRTDAGVHAEGQVASARIETRLSAAELQRALNAVLPADVAVAACAAVPDAFHARRDARAKLYRYAIWNGPVRSPLRSARTAAVAGRPLDLRAMKTAARRLVGTHDFSCFRASGSFVRDPVRTLLRVDVSGQAGAGVAIEVLGTGFLRHMVRNLAGTLIEVGRGRRTPASLGDLLASGDRTRAGPTAPAAGLTLVRVDYVSDGKSRR
jgi:tRNA pseudouridine38-40 synthase